jgi:sterol desaturase/sphingolipid hydroxylase (fatty acid hydroxylase superfamily)
MTHCITTTNNKPQTSNLKPFFMPTPLDILLDPVSLCIIGLYALLMIWEAAFPARPLPKIRFWRIKGIAFFFAFFFLSTYLPLWYAGWLPTSQLLNLSSVNPVLAGVIGVLLYELGMYVWHRSLHKNRWLWRICHQMHHSAERLDTYGAFYFSPFDMIGFTLLGTLCFSFIAGLPPQAITLFLLVSNFFSIFQHANIKTPVWLGYIVQRPESHAVHHAKGVHAYNYSDLPLFDILFGTFRNPSNYVKETGFYKGASARIKDMLLFKEVDKPEEKTAA